MWDNDGVFELSAGQIVADKYRIDGVMGTGGMGVVVAATHVELDQRVAIKFGIGPHFGTCQPRTLDISRGFDPRCNFC